MFTACILGVGAGSTESECSEDYMCPLEMFRSLKPLLDDLKFPTLVRPQESSNSMPSRELVNWASRVYCFAWLSQLRDLIGGLLSLVDGGNVPAARILGRSIFEFGAHAHYVHKHLK